MLRTDLEVHSIEEQREIEYKLKVTGYRKEVDCMWVKIYRKGNCEIVISREY